MNSHICPRCEGYIPTNATPGLYPGALSRTDNKTYICSACGEEEALLILAPQELWSVGKWDMDEFMYARQRMTERMAIESAIYDAFGFGGQEKI